MKAVKGYFQTALLSLFTIMQQHFGLKKQSKKTMLKEASVQIIFRTRVFGQDLHFRVTDIFGVPLNGRSHVQRVLCNNIDGLKSERVSAVISIKLDLIRMRLKINFIQTINHNFKVGISGADDVPTGILWVLH